MVAEDPPGKVLGRANDLLTNGGFRNYDLVHNNCFHFAFYCKTGRQYVGPVALVVEASKAAAVATMVPPPPPPPPPPLAAVAAAAAVAAMVPPRLPPPPRRRRSWLPDLPRLPQPSLETIAVVGLATGVALLAPELAPALAFL